MGMRHNDNAASFPPLPCVSMGEGGQSIMRQDVFRLGDNVMLRFESPIAFMAFDKVKSHRDWWPGQGSFSKLLTFVKKPSSARWAPSPTLCAGEGTGQGAGQLDRYPPLFSLGLIPQ